MYYLQKVFNCATCCAPKAYDFYGRIELGTPSKEKIHWERWSSSHPGAFVQSFSSGRFAYHYTISNNSIKIEAMTDSQEAATEWVARNLPKGNYKQGPIYVHGLTDRKPQSPLIFAGDPRYRDCLVDWAKGTPMPKIDPNAPISIP